MSTLKQFVGFKLADEDYAVDIMVVEEIISPVEMTPIPRAPSFIAGVIDIRDKVVPIANLRLKLHLPPQETTSDTRIIITHINNHRIGFIVDSVMHVLDINTDHINAAPMTTSIANHYIDGVVSIDNNIIVILDMISIFANYEEESDGKDS